MPTIRRPSGVEINLPAELVVREEAPAAVRRSRPGRQFGPVPLPSSTTGSSADKPWRKELVAAFRQQEMTLLDEVEMAAAPPAGGAARSRPATLASLELHVPLAAREDAVILLEQDGFYAWHFAAETKDAVPPVRRGQPAGTQGRQARFAISLAAGRQALPGSAATRGPIGDLLLGGVKAFIFKFAARVAVGQTMKFLERRVRRGLVCLTGLDPAAWSLLPDPAALALPAHRPARILLFIHGTFSSTVSAYGTLPATPWGRALLEAAYATYDVVLGFDHATLSEDPLENATELLALLQTIDWAYPPHFDMVTHSRGGLVLRCLLEELLPLTGLTWQVERAVFVGVTNGGTLLASPANWQALVDLYTNLAVGTCQLLGMLPQAKVLTVVLEEIARGLGAFVKYLATTAVTDQLVPGLAAMEPTGKFIGRLNQRQPQQPSIAQSYYCAVTSEFRPQLVGGSHEPRELSARLVQWLASGLMQELMQEANDLVVNTVSMTQIDPGAGNYLKDSLAFGQNAQVYHTNYFVWPQVVNALARWLRLTLPVGETNAPVVATLPAPRRGQRAPAAGRGPVPVGSLVTADLPAAVDVDIYVALASETVAETLAAVRTTHPSYVIIRRFGPGAPQDYVFRAEDILALAKQPGTIPLEAALQLAETPVSTVYANGRIPAGVALAVEPGAGWPGPATPGTHAVVQQRGRPIGVLPPATPLLTSTELVALARRVSRPRKEADFISQRRAMPTFRAAGAERSSLLLPKRPPVVAASAGGYETAPIRKPVATSKTRARPARSPESVTCHFRAEMDEVVAVGRPTTVEVQLAREDLPAAYHPAAGAGHAAVAADVPLLIQVVPRVNFALVQPVENYQVTLAPPAAGAPQALYFTLRATHVGEGEVWVKVLQNQVPLVTLCLQPRVAEHLASPAGRVQVGASAAEVAPVPAVHQLVITERRNGSQLTYHFELQLPGLQVLKWAETPPFTGDRQQYVEHIYEEIEQRWLSSATDQENFAAELRAIGGALFDQLIPAGLQPLLWQHRDAITSILVLSEEPFIPWELVHLHAPGKGISGDKLCFLGQRGLVRWLHEAGWPTQQLRLRPGKGRYVVPHYPHPDYALPEAEAEEAFLREELQAKRVAPTAQAVRALLQKPGTLDFLHFAGHGEASHGNSANAQILLEGRREEDNYLPEYLGATTVEQYAQFGKNAPLVILNACQVGRAGYQLTGIGGFAQAFLLRGAGAFVGTLWSVGDHPARTFTKTFYQQLRAGATLAEATTAAREQARLAGDATWLAYAVYGHPYARATTQ